MRKQQYQKKNIKNQVDSNKISPDNKSSQNNENSSRFEQRRSSNNVASHGLKPMISPKNLLLQNLQKKRHNQEMPK